MPATRLRGQDGLHRLQYEQTVNDSIASKPSTSKPNRSIKTVLKPPPPSIDLVAAAVANFAWFADRLGYDDAARTEILEALGLVEPAPAPSQPPVSGIVVAPRPTGRCPVCGRSAIGIRKNGTLGEHSTRHRRPASDSPCAGGTTTRPEVTR